MLFNSVAYALFLPVVWLAYVALRSQARYRNYLLLAASYYFYGSWDWRFLSLIGISTCVDFFCSNRIATLRADGAPKAVLKRYVLLSLVTNLSILGVFKYFDFFAVSLQSLLAPFSLAPSLPLLHVILPVGISFYTFQTLSYTIDVYRGELQPATRLADFALYVAFFPQLVAGPIERGSRLLPQILTPRKLNLSQCLDGLHLIAWGLAKKVFFADTVAPIVDAAFANPAITGPEILVALYAFSIQIYCDFSGYTDIARGTAKLFGFELMLNFRQPYFAKSPQDFWARWHISLSTWLRDYLYAPLGSNRRGGVRTDLNLLGTMLLGGLWHGAAATFVLWGLYQGALLVVFRHLNPGIATIGKRLPPYLRSLYSGLQIFLMFHITCYGWLLFRAASFAQIGELTGRLFSMETWIPGAGLGVVAAFAAPLLLVHLIQERTKRENFLSFEWLPHEGRVVVYSVLFYLVVFRTAEPRAFVYFQF